MTILFLLLFFAVFTFLLNLVFLVFGIILSKFKPTHRFGIRLIAMSLLMPGKCIACRCHQNCESAKCRNWTCANFYHCRQAKK